MSHYFFAGDIEDSECFVTANESDLVSSEGEKKESLRCLFFEESECGTFDNMKHNYRKG